MCVWFAFGYSRERGEAANDREVHQREGGCMVVVFHCAKARTQTHSGELSQNTIQKATPAQTGQTEFFMPRSVIHGFIQRELACVCILCSRCCYYRQTYTLMRIPRGNIFYVLYV